MSAVAATDPSDLAPLPVSLLVDEFREAARLVPEKRAEARQRVQGLLLKLGRRPKSVGIP